MKSLKFMLTALGLLCLSATGLAQSLPSYVPANGLVGWWPFNGNANDESGNGNNGIVGAGVTLTEDRFNNSNKAYFFNGQGNISLTSLPTTGNQDFTITTWIRTKDTTVRKGIACWGQDVPWSSTYFFVTSNGKLKFDFAYNGGPLSPIFLTDSSWHFVCVTSTAGLIQLFVDGSPTGPTAQMSPNINGNNKALGANIDNSGSNNFVGLLDDIAIYNRALTQQEITNLYNASTSAPAPCPTLPVNLQNGLVGYWPFCGNANDESGNGNNGTVNGATLTSDRFGNENKAYSFDGNLATKIQTNLVNTISGTKTFSVWFKVPSIFINPYSHLITCNNSGNDYLSLNGNEPSYISNNSVGKFYDGKSGILSTNKLNDNLWHNVILVHDFVNQKSILYIDGTLDGSLNSSNFISNPIVSSIAFGSVISGNISNSNATFFGDLDDICIWNRALDSTEITQLYQTQSSNSSMGNVGINVVAPQRNLHIKDVMRLEPRNTAPENPVKGDIYFDGLLNKLRVYDGTAWQNCW